MEHTLARSNIYALLSRIFMQELDEHFFTQMRNDEAIMEFFPTLQEWEPFKTLQNSTLLSEHLNPDFVNLTLLHLIPYETFYTRDDQMVETGGANPVTDMYSRFDFLVDYEAARVVSSDHIGVELEFMHHLCEAQRKAEHEGDAEAVAELIDVQKEFLFKHLLQWAPQYLISFKYEARTPLYYDAADLALEFILNDYEELQGA